MSDFLLDHPLLVIAGVVSLGILAQLIAARVHLPSILLLLGCGFLLSPAATGVFEPGRYISEDLLFSLVSAAVAIILLEGGLSLRLRELDEIAAPLWRMVSVGAVVTWALAALAAWLLLGLEPGVAILLGAILIVTGPTVIIPLLRHVRPSGPGAALVKWEGILSDPVGATLAVLIFEAIRLGEERGGAVFHIALGVLVTIAIGIGLGALAAWLLVRAMRHGLVPDHLQGVTCLALALVAFAASNMLQHESGLLTVTIMGIYLANQRTVPVKHVIEFKEHLGLLLISVLFIVLGARLTTSKLGQLDLAAFGFLVALVVLVRPLAVLAATLGSKLAWRDRIFVMGMAPRGIVAAAVASLFAFELQSANVAGAERLEPIVLAVVVGTVLVYGLGSAPLARRLGLSKRDPQGVILMGAHSWARTIARTLTEAGFPCLLVDTNREHVRAARMQGLNARHGNLLSEHTLDELDLGGIGKLIALTPNDEANSLAAVHARELFGRGEIYQLPGPGGSASKHASDLPSHLRGRTFPSADLTFARLAERFGHGAELKRTKLSSEFDHADFVARSGDSATILFVITETGRLRVATAGGKLEPKEGQSLVYLVDPQPAGDDVTSSPPAP